MLSIKTRDSFIFLMLKVLSQGCGWKYNIHSDRKHWNLPLTDTSIFTKTKTKQNTFIYLIVKSFILFLQETDMSVCLNTILGTCTNWPPWLFREHRLESPLLSQNIYEFKLGWSCLLEHIQIWNHLSCLFIYTQDPVLVGTIFGITSLDRTYSTGIQIYSVPQISKHLS